MRRSLLCAILLTGGLSLTAAFAEPVSPPAAGADPAAFISGERLLADVAYLAAPECDGRQPGTPGYARAAAFAAARFQALGLTPGGEDGYRQHFPIESNQVRAASLALVAGGPGRREYRLGPDFVCRGLTGSGRVQAPVVFVGYGLSRPEEGYDDYAGVDARGRVALAFKTPPPWTPSGGGWGDSHLPRPKAAAAAAHGAVALLLVAVPDTAQPARASQPIGSFLEGPGPRLDGFPSLQVSPAVAADLLAGSGADLATLWAEINAARAPRSRALPATVAIDVEAQYRPAADTVNLVGVLPGADPARSGEAVLIGAHLDHVGSQGEALLFPGANDNASGAAALLAVAEALVRSERRPPRSVVFVLFAGEESGLLGAKWHAAHPALPLARTVAMLNLDCVGCGDSLQVGNGRSVPGLWRLARELDAAGDRITVDRTWAGGGADATPFHEAGVPALYFATTNGYGQLHLPSDLPATLNGPLHCGVARLVLRTALAIAESAGPREEPVRQP